MQTTYHNPVMSREILTYLKPEAGQVFVDCTIGCGGHAEHILKAIAPNGRLIGIDQDSEALKTAQNRLENYRDCIALIHDNFENLGNILEKQEARKVNGILFDLGISSLQVDSPTRGFSFQHNAPLDMRMNQKNKLTAFDFINNLTEYELLKIIRNYGEEPRAKKIARLIIEERRKEAISSTAQFANLISRAVFLKKGSKIHPATKTFQAFRIAVNRELEALQKGLEAAIEFLASSGRICVISFHSLEDRIVKNIYSCAAHQHKVKIITKKPLLASEQEVSENPRARSAKLRVAEKIGEVK